MKFISSVVVLSCVILASSSHAAPNNPITPPLKSAAKINLNHASLEELSHAIKGIGKKRAQAIVQYRQQHGNFKSLTDLEAVRGIGAKFVQKNRAVLNEKFVC
ncbi:MAG: helix-hairpin-helix domain-containing protein [Gammaproteobacteria bacterium]|nr:helix-hairpin-helix domain-containing protein [Gammaproteobacteria bacterium]